jgi:hypothetical protein
MALAAAFAGFIALPRAPATRTVASPPDAGIAPGRVEIDTSPPGAALFVDGAPAGTSPAVVTMPPGVHELRATLAGRREWRDPAVTVGAGERVVYRPELIPANGRLHLTSTPAEAEAFLGDRDLGATPVDVELPAGDGAVHVRRPGYRDADRSVSIPDGQTLELAVTLDAIAQPQPAHVSQLGTINLYVDPWADVYADGHKVAEAPVMNLRLPVGRQALHLVNPVQNRTLDTVVDVPASGTRTYRLALP